MGRTPKKAGSVDPALTAAGKAAFISALEKRGVVMHACKLAKIPRRTAYEWREADKDFEAKWRDALDVAVEALEAEAYRRAKVGVKKPVYQNGELVGHIREFGDTLLMFLLKANRPEKYRERYELTGKDGGPIVGVLVVPGTCATPEDWTKLVAAQTAAKKDLKP